MIAIPYYFDKTLHLAPLFLYSFAVINLGVLFWGLYAGDIVDGFNRKDVFLGTNFIQGLIILSVASLGFKEGELPIVLILLVFTTTFFSYYIHYPNLYAFVQEITEPEYYTKVVAYIEIIGQSVTMLSGLIGGILLSGVDLVNNPVTGAPLNDFAIHIPKWELYEIILFNALTYFVSFITIIFIRPVSLKTVVHEDEGNLMVRLKIAYDYLKDNKLVTIFAICSFSIFIIIIVEMFALRMMYVTDYLKASGIVYGLSEFLVGGGALLAGIMISGILSRIPPPKSIIILVMLTTASLFYLTFNVHVAMLFVLSFILGFTNAGSRIFRVSYLFRVIPNEMAGRVNSLLNVIANVIRIIFILLFAVFATGENVIYAYLTLGIYTLASGLVLISLYKPLLKLTEPIDTSKENIDEA
jgi:MFS transporter, DHA3 family, macrolide efflux protein